MSETQLLTESPATQLQKETIPLRSGELLRYRPSSIRKDADTGEPAKPLLFVQGINGDARLPKVLEALAEEEQREIIAVTYPHILEGSTKRVTVPGIDSTANAVPEIDAFQALDLIEALDKAGVTSVDALGESRGAIRLVIALAQHPDRFRNVLLVHPAGQDNRNSFQTHISAAREGLQRKEKDEFDGKDKPWVKFRYLWQKRKEQKSVARAKLHNALSVVAEKYPDKRIMIAGDSNDKAFLPERLEANKGEKVQFMLTNWGGHGMGTNSNAIKEVSGTLRKMESQAQYSLAA